MNQNGNNRRQITFRQVKSCRAGVKEDGRGFVPFCINTSEPELKYQVPTVTALLKGQKHERCLTISSRENKEVEKN
jgi:hypothetical protein